MKPFLTLWFALLALGAGPVWGQASLLFFENAETYRDSLPDVYAELAPVADSSLAPADTNALWVVMHKSYFQYSYRGVSHNTRLVVYVDTVGGPTAISTHRDSTVWKRLDYLQNIYLTDFIQCVNDAYPHKHIVARSAVQSLPWANQDKMVIVVMRGHRVLFSFVCYGGYNFLKSVGMGLYDNVFSLLRLSASFHNPD